MKAVSTPTVISPLDTCQIPKAQTTSRPSSVKNDTLGENKRPDFVDAVIHRQVVLVGLAKARCLAPLLRKRFDHAHARNGVGQHVGHFAPDAVNLLEPGAQAVAHDMNHPGDKGQWHQRDQRQPGVDREQDDGRS